MDCSVSHLTVLTSVHTGQQVAATSRISCVLENFCESLCLHNRILSLQNVAKNQIRQNLCNLLWRQNSVAVSKICHKNSPVHTKRFVAARCSCNVLPQLAARCDLSPQCVAAIYCIVCSNLYSAQA